MPTFKQEFMGDNILLNRHGYRRRWYGVSVMNKYGAKAYLGSANNKQEGFALGQRFLYDWKKRYARR